MFICIEGIEIELQKILPIRLGGGEKYPALIVLDGIQGCGQQGRRNSQDSNEQSGFDFVFLMEIWVDYD